MDGFRVMPIAEAAKVARLFVTATGDIHVIRKEHFEVMQDGAIVANTGPLQRRDRHPGARELSATASAACASSSTSTRMADGRRIYLLAEGRLVNLSAAEGHPAAVMDMSFANQSLAAEYMVANHAELEKKVYVVPADIDAEIARLKLETMGRRHRHAHRRAGQVPGLLGPGHLSPQQPGGEAGAGDPAAPPSSRRSRARRPAQGRACARPRPQHKLRIETVEIRPDAVVLIDQLALPHDERYVTCTHLARGGRAHPRHDRARRAGHRRRRRRRPCAGRPRGRLRPRRRPRRLRRRPRRGRGRPGRHAAHRRQPHLGDRRDARPLAALRRRARRQCWLTLLARAREIHDDDIRRCYAIGALRRRAVQGRRRASSRTATPAPWRPPATARRWASSAPATSATAAPSRCSSTRRGPGCRARA